MADGVVVASTFVATVLEHSGYLTQSRLLSDFQSFFRDAGALVYLLCGGGAVVSVAVFGSFRSVQYLIVGPTLFWFLVGPTTESEGVLHRLGGGSYLGELGAQGREQSEQFRNRVLEKIAEDEPGRLDVAIGFWIFAKPISDFVNEMVDLLLDDEDASDLAANHKVAGLELIATALPYETDHILRLESFAHHCGRVVTSSVAAAELLVRADQSHTAGSGSGNELLQQQLSFELERVAQHSRHDEIDTLRTGFADLIERLASDSGASSHADRLSEAGDAYPSITCLDAWKLLAEETWHTAAREIPRVLRVARGMWAYEEALAAICGELTGVTAPSEESRQLAALASLADQALSSVFGEDAAVFGQIFPSCNIQPVIAMSMLGNHLSRGDSWGRIIRRHWNERDAFNPAQSTIITGPFQQGFMELRDESGGVITQFRPNGQGQSYPQMLVYRPGPSGSNQNTYMWAPISPLHGLRGMDHAMWVATRQYETVRLRQQIYTYAMQLPYYQGLALYFISASYPLMALLVLIPGRAYHFLNVPLAYLWVKSWDIGFAAVIILDRVMYNILPSWNVHPELRSEQKWLDATESLLVRAIAQGYNFDPMGSIHTYYTVIAMVTMGIPVISGMAIMRARRGVLSSFVDGPSEQAQERGQIAGNAYSIKAQNERNKMMHQVNSFAYLSSLSGAGGAEGGMAGVVGRAGGLVAAGGKVLSAENIKLLAGADPGISGGLLEGLAGGMESYYQAMGTHVPAEKNYEAAMRAAFDPNIGRFSNAQMFLEAYSSAMDGGGGFELNSPSGPAADALNSYLKALAARVDTATKNVGTMLQNSTKGLALHGLDVLGKGLKGNGKALEDQLQNQLRMMLMGSAGFWYYLQNSKGNPLEGLTGKDALDKLLSGIGKSLGATGFTNQELLARLIGLDQFLLADPSLRQTVKDALGESNFAAVMGVLKADPAPGGPSSFIEMQLSTLGGNRFLAAAPELAASAPPNFQFETPKTSLQAKGPWAESFLQQFELTMASRHEEYSLRLAADQAFLAMFPGAGNLYQQEAEALRQSLIQHLGGTQAVMDLWNHLANAKKGEAFAPEKEQAAKLKGLDPAKVLQPFATLEDASNISVVQLAYLVSSCDRHVGEASQNVLKSAQKNPNAKEKLSAEDVLAWQANIEFRRIPTGIAFLAQNNPRFALELMNEWLQRQRGVVGAGHSLGSALHGQKLMMSPEDFYNH